ncbi:MAG: excinuclease [Epsilonproteobacteria bacterium]|nr:MAG: excinuclease [Campylobacterota bacterium]
MKLLNLTITKLFDIFNHKIEYNQDERITIITAPNGYGKTMTLKVIYNLFNKKLNFFTRLVFDKIIFTFNNSQSIEIVKEKNDSNTIVEFILKKNNIVIGSFEYPSKKLISQLKRGMPSRQIEEYMPNFLERTSPNEWINRLTDEVLSFEEAIYQYSDYLPDQIMKQFDIDMPDEFISIINQLEVYFIQEQRLILRKPISDHKFRREVVITDTIEKYSQELSQKMKQTIGEYAQVTQSLDSSFPKRLFQEKTFEVDHKTLKNKLQSLQEQRKKTSEYGLLKLDEDTFFQEDEISDSDTRVLSLYIADSEEKLAVFSSLVNKIELFTKILNERRFNFKHIDIDQEKGFIFKSRNGSILKLTELSSGEQHEVVLLFELLFKATENSLVLIDEPEISLHVVWQKEFLNDIKEIIALKNIDIVIATHSPQIINDRWDLTVNLEASEVE